MTTTALAQLEPVRQELDVLGGSFEEMLEGSGISLPRFKRSVLFSIEKNPKLLECRRQTLFAAASSSAVLQLECDGVTGQSFLMPFGETAQCVIGYKGYNTLGGRSGASVGGDVVREGDEFDYDEGSNPFVHHKRALGDEYKRPILAAYATMMHFRRPPIVTVLSIDEINEIKSRSPAVRASAQTPWKDMKIGFAAMASKSAKRRLSRSMPLNTEADLRYHLAAAMEEQRDELGKMAYVGQGPKLITDGVEQPVPAPQATTDDLEKRELYAIADDGNRKVFGSKEEFKGLILARIDKSRTKKDLQEFIKRNQQALTDAEAIAPAEVDEIRKAYQAKLKGSK